MAMKWYFCLNEDGLNVFSEAVTVAVHSAIQNTTLEPHFIFDGSPNSLTNYLESHGVTVHFHQNSFLDRVNASKADNGYNPSVARGAYLRFDIPLVDDSDDIILYTDVDVIFCSDPKFDIVPKTIAACAEYTIHDSNPVEYPPIFNSGVLLMNLAGFRHELPELLALCDKHGFYFHGRGGYYDQGGLNIHFEDRWARLPQSFNWRCFGRSELEPVIIHFHGTKPYQLPKLVSGLPGQGREQETADAFFNIDKGSYIWAFGMYLRYLDSTANDAVSRSAETVQQLSKFEESRGLEYLKHLNDLCSFRFEGKRISASAFYGSEYLLEFREVLEKYIVSRRFVSVVEWGSGFTTILMKIILGRQCEGYEIKTYDNFKPYQEAVAQSLFAGETVKFYCEDLTGTGLSQSDPGLNFSTAPLRIQHHPDLIFIDSRRRVECAYIGCLIGGPNTIFVLHDFRRERYQPVIALYDVIEETSQFRVMKMNPDVYRAISARVNLVRSAMTSLDGQSLQ